MGHQSRIHPGIQESVVHVPSMTLDRCSFMVYSSLTGFGAMPDSKVPI